MMNLLKRFRKPKISAEFKRQVENYREGLRLMRNGDGADEWIGMDIARDARDALREMGYDIEGSRPDLIRINRNGDRVE